MATDTISGAAVMDLASVMVIDRRILKCHSGLAGGLGWADTDITDRARPHSKSHRWATYYLSGRRLGCWDLFTSRKAAEHRAVEFASRGY